MTLTSVPSHEMSSRTFVLGAPGRELCPESVGHIMVPWEISLESNIFRGMMVDNVPIFFSHPIINIDYFPRIFNNQVERTYFSQY